MNHRVWLSLSGLLLLLLLAAAPGVKGISKRLSPVGKTAFQPRFSNVPAVEEISSGNPIVANKVELSDFLRLSPKLHVASIAYFVAGVGLLRIEPAAKFIENLLSRVPLAAWDPKQQFHPMSAFDWVVHVGLLVFSLEIVGAFFSLMQQSDNDARTKKLYKGYLVVYVYAYVYTLFTMFSHAMIVHNTNLEHVLGNWFAGILQTTSIFGSGLAVTISPWALLPVFVLVNRGMCGFENWTGRILAMFSVYKYFIPELPALFKYSFIGMSVLPTMTSLLLKKILKVDDPYTDYDASHILVASVLGSFAVGMAYSLNRKVKYGN